MNKIIIVEDEVNLGETLKDYLQLKGFDTEWFQNIQQIKNYLNQMEQPPAVILLDIGLPDGNGLELAKYIKEKKYSIPILFLSAQSDPSTRLQGLEVGAEDFISKPFELKELILRLNKVLKTNPEQVIKHGKLQIWFNRFEVIDGNGQTIPLNQKEMGILKMLYTLSGQVVNREKILEEIWGEDVYPSNRTVDNYIVKLRKWIDTDPDTDLEISSVRGVGYKLQKKGR